MAELPENERFHIREVWSENLEEEFQLIFEIVDEFPYIALDTEFPGNVIEGSVAYRKTYQYLKQNVNATKLIQLGLTFTDKNGNFPKCGTNRNCVWQFNFKFNRQTDRHAPRSIEFLRDEAQINFDELSERGIDAYEKVKFGELLMRSGVLLNPNVTWVTFQGKYDFAYLIKIMLGKDEQLPDTKEDFYELMEANFPNFYDIKIALDHVNKYHGSLIDIANDMKVTIVGTSHQAGSDSLTTSGVFKKLKESGSMEEHAGKLDCLDEN